LAVAAVQSAAADVAATIDHAFAKFSTPSKAVRWWFDRASRNLVSSEYLEGRPIDTVSLEQAQRSPALTDASFRI
jgi:hypothetical protein